MLKGIIIAGGSGTRLYPVTRVVNKQLLPIYDKPMIYYPLSTLILAGIRDILIISSPDDTPLMAKLLGDGSQWGIKLSYAIQHQPEGIAQAFIIAEDFIADGPVALILGDNIFHGHGLTDTLRNLLPHQSGAQLFAYYVKQPERYGVLAFDEQGHVSDIVEKPQQPPSKYAVTGLYFYDNQVVEYAKSLKPSARGELEITDLSKCYLQAGQCRVEILKRGLSWLDTGTHSSLLDAGRYIEVLEKRQGLKVACIEEIVWRLGYIDTQQMLALAQTYQPSPYAQYLLDLTQGN